MGGEDRDGDTEVGDGATGGTEAHRGGNEETEPRTHRRTNQGTDNKAQPGDREARTEIRERGARLREDRNRAQETQKGCRGVGEAQRHREAQTRMGTEKIAEASPEKGNGPGSSKPCSAHRPGGFSTEASNRAPAHGGHPLWPGGP